MTNYTKVEILGYVLITFAVLVFAGGLIWYAVNEHNQTNSDLGAYVIMGFSLLLFIIALLMIEFY